MHACPRDLPLWMRRLEAIDYPIIDAHAHPYLRRDCPATGPVDLDDFDTELQAAGISRFCGAANLRNDGTDPSVVARESEIVLAWRRHFGERYYPGVNIHPDFPEESIAEVTRFHALGFRWVGEIAAYVQGYSLYATPELFRILEVVRDLGMTLNVHPSNLEDMDRLLAAFPTLNVVMAHPGKYGGCGAMYALCEKHRNAFLDLSGGGLPRWHMLRWGIDRLGAGRILFGTDYPVINPGMYLAGVLSEPLTDAERKAVLHDNFHALTAP